MTELGETTPEQRRLALMKWVEHLRAQKVITSRNNWCKLSGASESAVREFVGGRNDSMNERTYQLLASFAGVSPEALRHPPQLVSSKESQPDPRNFVLEAFDNADEADRQLILKLAERIAGKPLSKVSDGSGGS